MKALPAVCYCIVLVTLESLCALASFGLSRNLFSNIAGQAWVILLFIDLLFILSEQVAVSYTLIGLETLFVLVSIKAMKILIFVFSCRL